MFYSEIFMARKNHANAREQGQCSIIWHVIANYQESVATCSYSLEFVTLILTYFKPKDDLPNPKGP